MPALLLVDHQPAEGLSSISINQGWQGTAQNLLAVASQPDREEILAVTVEHQAIVSV